MESKRTVEELFAEIRDRAQSALSLLGTFDQALAGRKARLRDLPPIEQAMTAVRAEMVAVTAQLEQVGPAFARVLAAFAALAALLHDRVEA